MRSRFIALAALAALFFSPALAAAAPVWAPSQGGTVGANVACTNQNGDAIRCIQPSVTLNDATGVAIGTVGNPVAVSGTFTPSGTGDVNVKQVNGATVNVGVGAAGTGTQRVTTSTDSGNLAIGTNGAAAKTSSILGAVSDGTNQQQLVAPIALADGVNGNNSLAVGGYVWNGASWDRMPGSTTGLTTKSTLQAGSAIVGKVGIDQTTPGTTNQVYSNINQLGAAAVPTGGGALLSSAPFMPIGGVNGSSGSGALMARFSSADGSMWVSGGVASGVADLANPVKTGGKVNTAVQAFSNGNRADTQMTVTGATLTEEAGRSFNDIATATTTTVKSGAGFFHTLTINTYVASATITIYDSLSATGTKIATITLPSTITALGPQTLTYDVAFGTGLTIVTSGATDTTASYR